MSTRLTSSGKNAFVLLRRRTQLCVPQGGIKMCTKEPLILLTPIALEIGTCGGQITIQTQHDIFFPKTPFDIAHGDIRELLNEPHNAPTEIAHAYVYELKYKATFGQMFKQLHKNPRKLCFTEHQIVDFIRLHKDWLMVNDYCSTFFPFVFAKGKIGIAVVIFDAERSVDQFAFYSYGIWNLREWSTNFIRRLVVKAPPYQ